MVAGAMIEAVGDGTWEELIVADVFEPLGIEGASFEVPGTLGEEDAPWGHTVRRGEARPVQIDNDPALGPAGTVPARQRLGALRAPVHRRRGGGDR